MIALALALVTALAHVPKPVAMGTSWTAAQLAHLRSDVERTLASAPTLRGAHVGFIALETASGRVLFERGADDAFMPASTFKVLTGSAALQKLGPSFTFKTLVALAGDGRLVLRGGGDAQLSPSDLDAAAAAVAAAGVGTIDEIDGDASYFERAAYLPGWMVDDVPFYFAPALTSLCLDGNVVHLTVTPGTSAGARAGFSAIPNATLSIDNRVTTGAAKTASTVDVSREGATIVLVGSIPLEAAPEKVDAAVPDPSAYAIDIFTQALLAHGVDVAPTTRVRTMNEPVPAQRLLWSHDSAPLPQVLHDFWYRSDNLIGEMLLKSLGVARSGAPGTSESGAVLEAEWLRTLGIDRRKWT